MTDDAWRTLFEVKMCVANSSEGGDIHWEFQLINKHNSTVVGTYRDGAYAEKQARRKYKKLIKTLERHITS